MLRCRTPTSLHKACKKVHKKFLMALRKYSHQKEQHFGMIKNEKNRDRKNQNWKKSLFKPVAEGMRPSGGTAADAAIISVWILQRHDGRPCHWPTPFCWAEYSVQDYIRVSRTRGFTGRRIREAIRFRGQKTDWLWSWTLGKDSCTMEWKCIPLEK